MSSNIYTFILFYFLILFSTLGYGLAFVYSINNKKIGYNLGYVGLFGIFILILYSYLSNLFLSHSKIHNIFIIFIGFLFFSFFLLKNFKAMKKEIYNFIIIFSIMFISLLLFKTHDDFSYYHFPYSFYLTQNDFFVGVGQFNHGFRTISSIFYLNSLFYLPEINFYLFYITPIMFMGFANIILLKSIFSNTETQKTNFLNFLYILTFIFINIFFYRIAEHGTDRSAQILIFLLLAEILVFLNFKINFEKKLTTIYLLIGLIISLKAFYILYLLFLAPIFFYFSKKKGIKKSIRLFLLNNFTVLFSIIVFFVLFTNFINTGCLLYPVQFTCFASLDWTISLSEVSNMNDWYELWSKGGANPNYRVDNPEYYISGFNWVSNWFNIYFFNKVSDFLLGTTFICLIIYFSFFSKINKKENEKNFIFVYLILIILFFEWFYNHPSLRYGGYSLICLLIFIPFSFFLEKKKINLEKIKKRFVILVVLSLIIFVSRNVNRMFIEAKKYNYMPYQSVYFNLTEDNYRFEKLFKKLINNYNNCTEGNSNCDPNLKPIVTKKFGKYIFNKKK